MAIYVHLTEKCRDEAFQYQMLSSLKEVENLIACTQNFAVLNPHKKPFYQCRIGEFRAIFQKMVIGNDIFLIGIRFFSSLEHEFNTVFLHPTSDEFYAHNNFDLTDAAFLLALQKQADPAIEFDSADKLIHKWINITQADTKQPGLFLETATWIARIQSESNKSRLNLYAELVEHIFVQKPAAFFITEVHPEDATVKILFRYYQEYNYWLLVAPIDANNPDDEAELSEKYDAVINIPVPKLKVIQETSRRIYNADIVLNHDMWIDQIQLKPQSNLTLTDEETVILNPEHQEALAFSPPAYPLFISGRRNNMQQPLLGHLFADILRSYFEEDNRQTELFQPIYLAGSEKSKNETQDLVKNILSSSKTSASSPQIKSTGSYFDVIDPFLYNLLPATNQRAFAKIQFIDFVTFRKQFDHFCLNQSDNWISEQNASLIWHVIRTFIKGMRHLASDYLSPESYKRLPADNKTVSDKVYQAIYNKIWLRWYKPLCEKKNLWDRQDLVTTILACCPNEDFKTNTHYAIFCDEAQDLTQIELSLFYRISVYNRRTFNPELVRHIPFAFAGDQHRTVNPTGFNWSQLKENFQRFIMQATNQGQTENLSFNYHELTQNHRTSPQIVGLGNLIQLVRGVLFDDPDLLPQIALEETDVSAPPSLYLNNFLTGDLPRHPETVIIVPCLTGEEEQYVQQDQYLKEIAWNHFSDCISLNVMSAERAISFEFNRVVLYNFGDDCVKNHPSFVHMLNADKPSAMDLSHDEKLPINYYLNRLIVAISRPTKRLIIADTQEAIRLFWGFAEQGRKIKGLLESNPAAKENWPAEAIGRIQRGGFDRNAMAMDKDDPGTMADHFMASAIENQDVYLMQLAANNYGLAGRRDDMFKAQAHILALKNSFSAAGDAFAKIDLLDDAIRCYWQAGEKEKIIALAAEKNSNLDNSDNIHLKLALFLNEERQEGQTLATVAFILKGIHQHVSENNLHDLTAPNWAEVSAKIVSICRTSLSKEDIISDKVALASIIGLVNDVCGLGFEKPTDSVWAELALACGDIDLAKAEYDLLPADEKPDSATPWVNEILRTSTPFPENYAHLQLADDPSLLVNAYLDNQTAELDDEQVSGVLNAFIQTELRPDLAFTLWQNSENSNLMHFFGIWQNAINHQDFDISHQLAKLWIDQTFEKPDWDATLEFVQNLGIQEGSFGLNAAIQSFEWDRTLLHIKFLNILSTSDALFRTQQHYREQIGAYLRQLFADQSLSFADHHISLAGAVYERIGFMRDALKYYQDVIDSENNIITDDEKAFAKVRWLVCQSRLINITADQEQKEIIASAYLEYKNEWNIAEIPSINSYPEVARRPEIDASSIVSAATIAAENNPETEIYEESISISGDGAQSKLDTDLNEAAPSLHDESVLPASDEELYATEISSSGDGASSEIASDFPELIQEDVLTAISTTESALAEPISDIAPELTQKIEPETTPTHDLDELSLTEQFRQFEEALAEETKLEDSALLDSALEKDEVAAASALLPNEQPLQRAKTKVAFSFNLGEDREFSCTAYGKSRKVEIRDDNSGDLMTFYGKKVTFKSEDTDISQTGETQWLSIEYQIEIQAIVNQNNITCNIIDTSDEEDKIIFSLNV